MSTLIDLPIDLFIDLISNLSIPAIRQLCQSNSQIDRVCHNNRIWKQRFLKEFPYFPLLNDIDASNAWFEAYFDVHKSLLTPVTKVTITNYPDLLPSYGLSGWSLTDIQSALDCNYEQVGMIKNPQYSIKDHKTYLNEFLEQGLKYRENNQAVFAFTDNDDYVIAIALNLDGKYYWLERETWANLKKVYIVYLPPVFQADFELIFLDANEEIVPCYITSIFFKIVQASLPNSFS